MTRESKPQCIFGLLERNVVYAWEGEVAELRAEVERLTERGMEAEAWCNQLNVEIERLKADETASYELLADNLMKRDIEIERLRTLLAEAIPYIDRARISHLGTDPIVAAHNGRCLSFISRVRAALEHKP